VHVHAPDHPAPLQFRPLVGVRVTAQPVALAAITWPSSAIVVQIAPDDVFVIDATLDDAAAVTGLDPYAIVEHETMFRGAWLDAAQLAALVHKLEWALPSERPSLAQGMACGLAIKVVQLEERTLLIVSGSALHEVPERLGAVA
jgi:hypothetical protein